MLHTLQTDLAVTAGNVTKPYDGQPWSGGSASYSVPAANPTPPDAALRDALAGLVPGGPGNPPNPPAQDLFGQVGDGIRMPEGS